MRMPAFLPALLLALFASLVLSTRALHAQDISVGDIEPDLQVGMSLAAADEPIEKPVRIRVREGQPGTHHV